MTPRTITMPLGECYFNQSSPWFFLCCSVALNFQTAGVEMDLNDGLFSQNGHSGYVLKPDFMRGSGRRFDAETQQSRDGYQPLSLSIQVMKRNKSRLWKIKSYSSLHPLSPPPSPFSLRLVQMSLPSFLCVCLQGDQWTAASESEYQRGLHRGPAGESGDPWSSCGPG